LLLFAFFYFSESGHFKGLRPIQMKIFSSSQVICEMSRLPFATAFHLSPTGARQARVWGGWNKYTTNSPFRKGFVDSPLIRPISQKVGEAPRARLVRMAGQAPERVRGRH
jgi:hypothetical protein